MLHVMGLQEKYFDFIENGTKEYEIRLNDEKRQKMNTNVLFRQIQMRKIS